MAHAKTTRFRLSAKRTSPLKSAGASVQSSTGSPGVRISDSNDGYTMFRGSVKSTGYPLHSPVSPSVFPPCVTVCHHILTGLYEFMSCLYQVGKNAPEIASMLWSYWVLNLARQCLTAGQYPMPTTTISHWLSRGPSYCLHYSYLMLLPYRRLNFYPEDEDFRLLENCVPISQTIRCQNHLQNHQLYRYNKTSV